MLKILEVYFLRINYELIASPYKIPVSAPVMFLGPVQPQNTCWNSDAWGEYRLVSHGDIE